MKNYSVYIMVQPNTRIEGYNNGMYCKIGFSENPEKRLIQVDTQVKSVYLVSEYEFISKDNPREYIMLLEKLLHKICKHYHVKKEWFYLDLNKIRILDELIVNFFDVKPYYHNKQFINCDLDENIEIDLSLEYYFK
jgi:hypothetical protein